MFRGMLKSILGIVSQAKKKKCNNGMSRVKAKMCLGGSIFLHKAPPPLPPVFIDKWVIVFMSRCHYNHKNNDSFKL